MGREVGRYLVGRGVRLTGSGEHIERFSVELQYIKVVSFEMYFQIRVNPKKSLVFGETGKEL